MTSLEIFEKVIRVFRRQPDPSEALTLNQIASLALGRGNSKNTGLVGRVLNEFRVYFRAPGPIGYKWRVNWDAVRRDHGHLFEASTSKAPTSEAIPALEGMIQALEDEILAVRRELEEHPVASLGVSQLGVAGDGAFLYEAVLDLPGDAELPIPEGVGVILRWGGAVEPSHIEATLLNYEVLNARAILETESPLSSSHLRSTFVILPRIDQLVKTIRNKLEALRARPDALVWRLLDSQPTPRWLSWNGPLDASDLDESQLACVQACLTRDLTFVWGPPGTGKTHTLARIIAKAALSGRRVLGAAIANVAVDQLAAKVVDALETEGADGQALLDGGRVIRFGHPRLPKVTAERRLFPFQDVIQRLRRELDAALQEHRSIPPHEPIKRALVMKRVKDLRDELRKVMVEFIQGSRILLTTAVQVCMEPAIAQGQFDMTVVDEASMMPIPHLMCMGAMSEGRLVIAGDFRQLGPIALSRSAASVHWLHRDIYELVGIDRRSNHPVVAMLTHQRRMHQDICDLINEPFYEGRLETASNEQKVKASSLPPLEGKAVVLVSYTADEGSQVEATAGGSRKNEGSASLTTRVVRCCLAADPHVRIGVITPYRAQASLIRRLLTEAGLGERLGEQVRVGTVHAFQGSEADVIIWDMVESRHHRVGKLFRGSSGRRLVNVAISRAQGKFIVVGDPRVLLDAPGAEAVTDISSILLNAFSGSKRNIIHPSAL